MGIRILVLDPDEVAGRILAASLIAKGHHALATTTGADAVREVGRERPQLIIVTATSPQLDAASWVRGLRARPETGLIPVIFLGPRESIESQVAGFKLASDGFLTKPVDEKALEGAIEQCLKEQARTEAEIAAIRPPARTAEDFSIPPPMMTFRGTLEQIGLPTLLTLFEMERKTGMLVLIVEPEKDKVRIFFNEGRAIRALVDGREHPRHAELIYWLLGKTQGKFDFRPAVINPKDEIKMPTAMLLLEGARLLDESRRGLRP